MRIERGFASGLLDRARKEGEDLAEVYLKSARKLSLRSARRKEKHREKGLVEKGLYVTDAMGMHTANPVSGEFSIGVSGLWIEKGSVKHAVKEAMISGNVLDFFMRIEAAGDDVRSYGNMASPSLLIGPTDISA